MATLSRTILSRTPSTIISHLADVKGKYYDAARHSLLFTLSPPPSNDDLASIVYSLTSFSERSVGCISSPEPAHNQDVISCSITLLDNATTSLFRSTIPGREMIQVGRWHSYTPKNNRETRSEEKSLDEVGWVGQDDPRESGGRVDWEVVWNQRARNSESFEDLPEGLQSIRPDTVNQILYLSDPSPEGLVSTLRSRFPAATQLGLLASSTPFITGRPVTLVHNGKVYEDGAVGVAFTAPKLSSELSLRLPEAVKPLGQEMTVTRAEGNLINTLDGANPTRLLLRAIQTAGIDSTSEAAILFKEEEEFYLGVYGDGDVSQIYTITSGDTSRGTIALNTTRAPAIGAKVQFFRRSKRAQPYFPPCATEQRSLTFKIADSETYGEAFAEDTVVLDNMFHAASENGFIVSRGGEIPWTCTVPGCIATVGL
ncbi:hypothetical protein V5O48_005477 [Marasmius crinis-equi]|uniref:FIST domain-containing protein n=1 Tax=Marasmius crinis-equi TaxID=585013 RepID=A0ABR3FM52_9AGAR